MADAAKTQVPQTTTNPIALLEKDKKFMGQFNGRRLEKSVKLSLELEYIKAAALKDDRIYECTVFSVQNTLFQLAATGLSFNPVLKQAYPIRYSDQLQLYVAYGGMAHLCFRAGVLKALNVALVHQLDKFRVITHDNRRIVQHEEFMGEKRGDVTHAYCIADFINGGQHVEVMTIEDLLQCEKAAKKKGGGAVWSSPWRGQMMKKSVVRRAWNYWPKDNGGVLEAAQRVMDEAEPMDFSQEPETAPESQELLVTPVQIEALRQVCRDLELTDETRIERNLQLLADSYRCRSITDLPDRFYEDAKTKLSQRMQARQTKIAERNTTNPSTPEGRTP